MQFALILPLNDNGNKHCKKFLERIPATDGGLKPFAPQKPGSRNCAAWQRALQIILDFADKLSKRNII